jgi:hypothetical protein
MTQEPDPNKLNKPKPNVTGQGTLSGELEPEKSHAGQATLEGKPPKKEKTKGSDCSH